MGQGVLTGPATISPALLPDAGLDRGPDGALRLLGVDLHVIAAEVGTPAYVYSADLMQARYRELSAAFAAVPHRIHYAVKANGNLAVLQVFARLGAGADIVSVGELARCRLAGFPAERIVFSGVGKTPEELEEAAGAGLGSINVESLEELAQLGAIATRRGLTVRVGVRFNPDVSAGAHPYISTGASGIKFGVPADQVAEAARIVQAHPGLDLVTVALHIGSQILEVAPFRAAAECLVDLVGQVRAAGITTLRAVDLGGGLGIRYADEEPPTPATFAAAVLPVLAPLGLTVHLEPGRYLVGNAGLLLTRVIYRKDAAGKVFAVVDAGMTELVRPSRYGAYHHIEPAVVRAGAPEVVDVVGPVCETGDFLALERPLPPLVAGDLLAVLGAGAYGFVMGSTYNARPRPPEVLVSGGRWQVVRPRETVPSLTAGELLLED